MRLTFERGGGGGAGVVAGMVVGLLLCCSAFTRQPPQVAAAALYKLLYRLPHHSAMSLAPQPAALRFRECCRCAVRLESSRKGREETSRKTRHSSKNREMRVFARRQPSRDPPDYCLQGLRCHPPETCRGTQRNGRTKPCVDGERGRLCRRAAYMRQPAPVYSAPLIAQNTHARAQR